MSAKSTTQAAPPSLAEEIAFHTRRLAELKREEEVERKARIKAVKAHMQYTVTPTPPRDRWDFIGDEMCVFYTISAECLNREELRAAGAMDPFTGSMRYVFNLATSRLVCHVGGGNIHLPSTAEAYADVSAFISEHPEGGDITEIVLGHRREATR